MQSQPKKNDFLLELEKRIELRKQTEKETFILQELKSAIDEFFIFDKTKRTRTLKELNLLLQKRFSLTPQKMKDYQKYLNKLGIYRLDNKYPDSANEKRGSCYVGIFPKDRQKLADYYVKEGVSTDLLKRINLLPFDSEEERLELLRLRKKGETKFSSS